jgi:cell division septum initiation protein DivIVA
MMEIEWLDGLETRVREAVDRLADLREENASLRERVRDLETKLAVTTAPPAEAGDADRLREENESLQGRIVELEERLATAESAESGRGEASGQWEREREEVRRRMEALTRRLEELASL